VALGDADFTARARALRWMLCDVDGVLTDGRLYYGAGEPLVAFDIKDGYAMKAARRSGLKVGILTGRNTPAVAARAADLALDATILGREDKGAAFDEFLGRITPGGTLVTCVDDPGAAALADTARGRGITVRTYGRAEGVDARLLAFRPDGSGARITASLDGVEHRLRLPARRVGTQLHFADGTSARGDLLIGADGVHSHARAAMFPEAPAPVFVGVVGVGGVVPAAAVPSLTVYGALLAPSPTATHVAATV